MYTSCPTCSAWAPALLLLYYCNVYQLPYLFSMGSSITAPILL
jgi:hypothetical protein